jgi:hypothetical protein
MRLKRPRTDSNNKKGEKDEQGGGKDQEQATGD